jgi:hypothetical protein
LLAYLLISSTFLYGPRPPIPGALVGKVRRLDARLEAEDRERAFWLSASEGSGTSPPDEINVLGGFLLTRRLALGGAQALARLLLGYRLLAPGRIL